jgi:hypothetical protein
MYCTAQLLRFWRGLEYGEVITTLGMYIAVTWVKSLKILVDHFD